jgi:hypothetical protein
MDRRLLNLRITVPATGTPDNTWIAFRGDFGGAGRPVLAFEMHDPEEGEGK